MLRLNSINMLRKKPDLTRNGKRASDLISCRTLRNKLTNAGMQMDTIPRDSNRFHRIQADPSRCQQMPAGSTSFQQIPTGSTSFHQIPADPNRSGQIPTLKGPASLAERASLRPPLQIPADSTTESNRFYEIPAGLASLAVTQIPTDSNRFQKNQMDSNTAIMQL